MYNRERLNVSVGKRLRTWGFGGAKESALAGMGQGCAMPLCVLGDLGALAVQDLYRWPTNSA